MYKYSNQKINPLFGNLEDHLKFKGVWEKSDYVKLANQVDRDTLCKPLEQAYCTDNGRGSINARRMLALEMLKHMLKLSDEKMVHQLQTNLEVQYFCGIQHMYEDTKMESSSMTHFRNRIAEYSEILDEIQKIHLKDTIRKLPKRVQGQYDQDSTVINESVKYPHDIDLLNDVVQKGAEWIKKGKIRGKNELEGMVAKGKKQAKKLQLAYSFSKGRAKKGFEATKKEMIKLAAQMVKTVESGYERIKYLRNKGKKGLERGKVQMKEFVELGKEVIEQQKKLLKQKLEGGKQSVQKRIVSLHKSYVRPIAKGKKGKKVQFGAKAQIGMIGKKVAVAVSISRENEHDSKNTIKGVELVEAVRGKPPSEVGYDKGGRSQAVYDYLREKGITNGIQGSKEYESLPKKTKKRLYNRRAFNENIINDVLNHRGVNNSKYNKKNTEWSLLMGCMASNLIRVW